ncbi:hypothetical protein CUJ83_00310 [Methanocella sp. CWC-04]|uniref:Arabinogalactan endo-beta-1,4-galactanase n=1 Tax=Methanooceanicella nereidis TaxID=2052831 RepID=A0AAP2RCB5_9EURY|nr:glycosyl hydrolase 53 family protein [Methanocella sp. CWC-04]MCD1293440.1 hypothetical protein [Methanocella sp. CWC-04]
MLSGCTQNDGASVTATPATYGGYSLPLSERDFYLGVVPTPKNVPATTFEDMNDAYRETGELAEVSMVWVDPSGIGEYDRLKNNKVITAMRVYGLKPVVTLSFAAIEPMPGKGLQYVVDAPEGVKADLSDPVFRSMWVNEARNIARDFKPEYFSLGNEVNDYFYLHPEDLDSYLSLYDEAYSAIKEVSPNTKVFVVFSYNHMIDNDQYWMLTRFSDRSDIVGLTTYPWQHFDDPGNIPEDYYSRLIKYTDRPLAFTEIGWVSSQNKESSEEEQARFLIKFLELTKDNELEMVNWLFLHEMPAEGLAAIASQPETMTISLKNADGSKKKIYDVWAGLRSIKLVR